MKTEFRGYYRPTPTEFEELWKKGVVALDTSVLLNLYRYSQATAGALLDRLTRLRDQLWLPHQVGAEYQRNRLSVISAQMRAYRDIPDDLGKSLAALIQRYSRHPFVDTELIKEICARAERDIKNILDRANEVHPDLLKEDGIRTKLSELFEGKVGSPFTREQLEQLYAEGATRYAKKIPPGYADVTKSEEQKYGDLVIWRQLVEHAREQNRPIILVCDDKKEDWWWKHDGRTVGPLPALVEEMLCDAQQAFYMYDASQFLEWEGQKDQGGEETESAVREIKEVAEARTAAQSDKIPRDKLLELLVSRELEQRGGLLRAARSSGGDTGPQRASLDALSRYIDDEAITIAWNDIRDPGTREAISVAIREALSGTSGPWAVGIDPAPGPNTTWFLSLAGPKGSENMVFHDADRRPAVVARRVREAAWRLTDGP